MKEAPGPRVVGDQHLVRVISEIDVPNPNSQATNQKVVRDEKYIGHNQQAQPPAEFGESLTDKRSRRQSTPVSSGKKIGGREKKTKNH